MGLVLTSFWFPLYGFSVVPILPTYRTLTFFRIFIALGIIYMGITKSGYSSFNFHQVGRGEGGNNRERNYLHDIDETDFIFK